MIEHIDRIILIVLTAFVIQVPFTAQSGEAARIELRYISAVDFHEMLSEASPEIAREIEKIDIKGNALELAEESRSLLELLKLVESLDQRPTQVQLSCTITEAGKDGDSRIVSRPTIYVLAGKPATISFGNYEIEIIPEIVPTDS